MHQDINVQTIDRSKQLIIVNPNSWDSVKAKMSYFDKDKNNDWVLVKKNIDVVIGKKGLAPTESFEYSKLANKTEGDSKTPAGVFKIGKTFGFEDSDLSNYVQVKTGIECIDDSGSKYYNDIINTSKYTKDWQSSEHMAKVPQYKYGIELLYNHNPAEAKKGSCIFMHIWKSPSTGTEGCTAMAETDIKNLQSWIKSSKNPVIVQLTSKSYEQVKAQWHLPNLS